MTPRQQQARRRELHAMTTTQLRNLYARVSEVKVGFQRLSDEGRQIMIDSIVRREIERGK